MDADHRLSVNFDVQSHRSGSVNVIRNRRSSITKDNKERKKQQDVHRILTTLNCENGVRFEKITRTRVFNILKEVLVQIHVQRCTRDDDSQILPLSNDLLQKAKEDVVLNRPLVDFVNHDHTIVIQLRNDPEED